MYVSVRDAWTFDPARHFVFGTGRRFTEVSPDTLRDIDVAMKVAQAAWLGTSRPPSLSWSDRELRDVLARVEDYEGRIWKMDTPRVARAVLDAVQRGKLIFVPLPDDLRACVKAIQQERARQAAGGAPCAATDGPSSSPRPTPLGNTQPFKYSDDSVDENLIDLAARGVSEEDEAACAAQYDNEMDQCQFARAIYQDPRTYALCTQRAFSRYQACRGY